MSEGYRVVLESEECGREVFTYVSLDDAYKGIERLRQAAQSENDGVVRTIGFVVGEDAQEDEDEE